ncbi:MAG TPA: DUF1592 domain-containing protein [Polyangiaceae bacterium]|nr:DUF1592 domain-containing protein [Polyangiaceae bacterium]
MHRSVGTGLVCASLALLSSCSPGRIGALGGGAQDDPASPGGAGTGKPGSPMQGGVPGSPANPTGLTEADCLAKPPTPGPSFLRRLNRFEYDNTVRDLLGDSSQPASAFPPEEKRLGFDNNATALQVSPALVEQYMLTAETLAKSVLANNRSKIVSCDSAADAAGCETTFITEFGARAYRRPLTDAEVGTLRTVFDAGAATDFDTGVRLVVETVLQSAPFLYRVEFGATPASGETVVRLTSWEMASRLSYLVWQSMPDDELFAKATAGELDTPERIGEQVKRMLEDPKAHDVFAHFHDQWLKLDLLSGIDKDTAVFPTFSAPLAPLMTSETQKFLDWVVFQGPGTLDALLTSNVSFLNADLATYYGVSGVSGSDFQQVTLDDTRNAGFLTKGGLMAMLGKANQTAPVQRGKFVREQLLCQPLKPPPANIMIKPPELSSTLSTRERFAAHRTQTLCASCHELMDPIGLGFENFDGAGLFRTTENGKSIDATGQVNESDIPGTFDGAVDLAKKLAGSDQVRSCVATSWFRFANGRAETEDDACTMLGVTKKFSDAKYDLKTLLVALAESDSFQYRRVVPAGGQQ